MPIALNGERGEEKRKGGRRGQRKKERRERKIERELGESEVQRKRGSERKREK